MHCGSPHFPYRNKSRSLTAPLCEWPVAQDNRTCEWSVTDCHAAHARAVTDGNWRTKLHFSEPPIPKEAAVEMSTGTSASGAGLVFA